MSDSIHYAETFFCIFEAFYKNLIILAQQASVYDHIHIINDIIMMLFEYDFPTFNENGI